MTSGPDDLLLVSLPRDIGTRVTAAARDQHRNVDDVVVEACRQYLIGPEATVAAADEQYQRGYELTPEDPADAEALLPHLPLPSEDWA